MLYKEDFLNLDVAGGLRAGQVPSLGWSDGHWSAPAGSRRRPEPPRPCRARTIRSTNASWRSLTTSTPARSSPPTFASTTVRLDEQLSHCEDWDMWLRLRRTLGYRFAFLGECTSVYHQVPHRHSVVASAYQASPTPFTLARAGLYRTWPAPDAHAAGYRDWFTRFDHRLDALITRGRPVPRHLYEHAVRMLHEPFAAGAPADMAWLDSLFPGPHEHAAHTRPEAAHAGR